MGNLRNVTLLLCIFLICKIRVGYTNSNSYANVSCIDTERQALMEFKGSLVDTANRLASWTGEDCCSWDGITCSHRTRHVKKLNLRNPSCQFYWDEENHAFYCNNCLGGEINPSILDLEHLVYLDLSCNNFSGIQIPTFLGSLKNIRYLNLSGAELSGYIPPHLGNLSNLEYLALGSFIDMQFANFLTTKSLKWITGLTSLKSLDLSSTDLSESVDWLNSVNMLPSLSSLTLRACGLGGRIFTPVSHVNLTSLVYVDLGRNFLNSTLPVWLFNLSSLAIFKLDYNFLQGPIPGMLEKLTHLTVLDLSGNNFSSLSVLDSVCNQTSLISIRLRVNRLSGSLPLCLGNLTSLRVLDLGNNKFGGKIPSGLGHLKELSELRLNSNSFKCSIPSSFGQLTKLKYLYLSYNQLNGTTPSTLGQLRLLQELDISFNSLTGVLSESLFVKLKALKMLSISGNYFLTFNVSSQWIPPFQLETFAMDNVTGTQFPSWIQTQRNVERVSMINASISGPILLFDANHTTNLPLRMLDLGYNNLTGNIPEYLCNLSSISSIYLANNQLTGRIPLCLGNLKQLKVLDLSNNRLCGHIPSTLGNLERLVI